jgi:hypothetical protein
MENLQSQGLTGSNIGPSEAVSSGNGAVAPQHLTPIGFSSYGEWHNNVPYKPDYKAVPNFFK